MNLIADIPFAMFAIVLITITVIIFLFRAIFIAIKRLEKEIKKF